jgi:TAT-translocated FGD2 family F420-dependent dehydrogenase
MTIASPDSRRVDAAPSRRHLLASTAAAFAAAGALSQRTDAQPIRRSTSPAGRNAMPISAMQPTTPLNRQKLVGYMLAHEQFTVPHLVDIAEMAAASGFGLLATSDHFQPWQADEGHSGSAWVTLGAAGAHTRTTWMGTTVTCPTLRYNPAVVAEAFASLSLLYPGRIFLGVGSGEALNENAATGQWPKWPERWERLVEAIDIIRALWAGQPVAHQGKHYKIEARLYDPPAQPIPLMTAANGKKSMRLAGQHGDGLITDPLTWQKFKNEWEAGARTAGKNPADMPVLVEQFVAVDRNAAPQAAELWRFIPAAFKKYYNITDPAEIERRADAEVPIDKVMADWPIGDDPGVHVAAIEKLFDSGATIVNIHSGEADQRRVVEFYGKSVLPKLHSRV